jgi:capsular polysaccharide biosynthesis protein
MDVNEILLRTVRGHWLLLLACLLLPPLAVGALSLATPTTYTSWTRLQGGTVLPGSETEADAMLNMVKGVATSPEMVRRAFEEVGVVGRDPMKTTAEIDVTRLGSAAVFDMSVTDVDPEIATALAQALATDVVGYLNNAGDARTANLLGGLGNRQKELLDQRQKVAAMLTLTKEPVGSADLAAELSGIDQQLADLSSTMRQLQLGGTSAAGSAGSAAVISPAVSTGRTPTNLLTDLGLALVAGLIVGLLAATILEVLRPRVPDARVFAREIGVPMIGQLAGATKDEVVPDREMGLALSRAAARAEVSQVLLLGPPSAEGLVAIAAALRRLVQPKPIIVASVRRPSPRPRQLADNKRPEPGLARTTAVLEPSTERSGPARPPLDVRALSGQDSDGLAEHVGLVPVVLRFARYSELRRIDDLAAATGWPVIGVIGDPRSAPRWSRSCRSGRT